MSNKNTNQLSEITVPALTDFLNGWDTSLGIAGKISILKALLLLQSGGADWAPVSYTPTYVNLTVGNGVNLGRYIRLGNLIFVRTLLTMGTTTSVAGAVTISLPVTANGALSGNYGGGVFVGAGTFPLIITYNTTTAGSITVHNTASTYGSLNSFAPTVPINPSYANGYTLSTDLLYEAA